MSCLFRNSAAFLTMDGKIEVQGYCKRVSVCYMRKNDACQRLVGTFVTSS